MIVFTTWTAIQSRMNHLNFMENVEILQRAHIYVVQISRKEIYVASQGQMSWGDLEMR